MYTNHSVEINVAATSNMPTGVDNLSKISSALAVRQAVSVRVHQDDDDVPLGGGGGGGAGDESDASDGHVGN